MRILIYITALLVIATTFAISCINNQKPASLNERLENKASLEANVIGIYSGDLPCADCDAIKTVLKVDRDNSYRLQYIYEGKSADEFVKEGSWEIEKNQLILDGVDYNYKIESEILIQLDLSGNEIKGDIAEQYQLAKFK